MSRSRSRSRSRLRSRLALAVVPALLLVLASCGSSGDDASSTTTASDGTTSTSVAGSADGTDDDEALMGEFLDRYRPGLELVFEGDQLDCVLQAFEESALGDSSDAVVEAAYEDCGTTAQAATGAMMAADLMTGGASESSAACVAKAVGRLSQDQVSSMDEVAGAKLYTDCGIDPTKVGG